MKLFKYLYLKGKVKGNQLELEVKNIIGLRKDDVIRIKHGESKLPL
jgi:hypothetical protein